MSFSTLRVALTILKANYTQATPYVSSDWAKAGGCGSSLVSSFPLNALHLYFVNFCAFIELHCKSCIDLEACSKTQHDNLHSCPKTEEEHSTALLSNEWTKFLLTLGEVKTVEEREGKRERYFPSYKPHFSVVG